MVYADTDFFVAILKEGDWLQQRARRVYQQHKGSIWTSPATLMELLLLARSLSLDPERVMTSVLKIAGLRGGEDRVYYLAARYMKRFRMTAIDAVHAAFCGKDESIISSDKVFDQLGMKRIKLEAA